MVKVGDIISIVELNIKRKPARPIEGKVCGIYDKYFTIECVKGYKESFLYSDFSIGRFSIKIINDL